jgi:Domain of unknown function (DUF4249)
MKNLIKSLFLLTAFLTSCDLEKVIEIDLPEYTNQLSVEWYIEAGKPFRMTLTESVSYFDSARLPIINDALVVISYNGISDTLRNGFLQDSTRFYNYFSNKIAPNQVGTVFNMYIKDKKGREVRAVTTLLPIAQLDSLRLLWNKSDTLASVLTSIQDNPNEKNYYRLFLHKGDTRRRPESRRWLTDQTATNNRLTIGSRFEFVKGDTVIATVYHLTKDYYDFINSSDDAEDANQSPFDPPSAIFSNIRGGGIGIFTTIVADRDTLIIKK